MNIGFAMCGSFCTFSKVFPVMSALSKGHNVIPIFSEVSYSTDSRFGSAAEHIQNAYDITGKMPLHTIAQVEPIGPKKLLDILLVAPCTGNTLAKIAHSIADGPVTMAVKSHLRNQKPVVIAISTNDALGASFKNIGMLMNMKNIYFVPFGQDNCKSKPNSMIAKMELLPDAIEAAMHGKQMQPILQLPS